MGMQEVKQLNFDIQKTLNFYLFREKSVNQHLLSSDFNPSVPILPRGPSFYACL